ncbi:hypothetical protein X975_04553, partial [Stegodyphus mimosarum]
MDHGDNVKDLEELMDTNIICLSNDSHFAAEATETQERLQDFSDDFEVSQQFYAILMLKKLDIIELEQQTAYEEIIIVKGKIFISTCGSYFK